MKDLNQVSRRQFIAWSVGAASVAISASTAVLSTPRIARAEEIALPLPYGSGINPEYVRQCAFNHYFNGGCMHGAASGLMEAFKEVYAEENTGWDLLPIGMYKYGSGGVAGWGTLCGILNGCMAVLNLIGLHGELGDHLMNWYSTTLFPTANCEGFVAATGQKAIPDEDVRAHTVSESPLCHISISKWCKAAGVSVSDTSKSGVRYKDDRCSKICADTAAKTAELINEYADYRKILEPFAAPAQYVRCLDCHSGRKDQVGKMDCLGCHVPDHVVKVGSQHPGKGKRRF